MEAKDDKLVVNVNPVDSVHGAKPEPEERPVVRQISTDATVRDNVNPDGSPGKIIEGLSIPTTVETDMTVAQACTYVENQCFSCAHFNNARWLRLYNAWVADPDPVHKASFQTFMAQLVGGGDSQNPISPESADKEARSRGICDAISDALYSGGLSHADSVTIVQPLGMCLQSYAVGDVAVTWEPNYPYEPRDEFVNADRRRRREELLRIASAANRK